MKIHLIREGKEEGPFSAATLRRMLQAGEVRGRDRAWHRGMEDWGRVEEVVSAIPEDLFEAAEEAATPQQKAFLSYLGISFSRELSADEAARLLNQALDKPRDPARLARWPEERARLYPEIFAEDLQVKKEQRADLYLRKVQEEGRDCFLNVGKAHCQVLLSFMDVKYPNWEAYGPVDAAWNYFFPALAQQFPSLVTKAWRGKLKFRSGPRVAAEVTHASIPHQEEAPEPAHPSKFWPLTALAAVFALVAGGAYWQWQHPSTQAAPIVVSGTPLPGPGPGAMGQGNYAASTAAPEAAATPQMLASKTETPRRKRQRVKPPVEMAIPEAPTTEVTANAEPPASAVEPPPSPALPSAPVATPAPLLAVPTIKSRASITLVRPIEVQLTYGRIVLPTGTSLKFISAEGDWVNVGYMNSVVPVPLRSTDLAQVR